jgi:hypothetical protein
MDVQRLLELAVFIVAIQRLVFKKFKFFPDLPISNISHFQAASDYEVILEKIESAFGEDDKTLAFESLRVKKFNRTT